MSKAKLISLTALLLGGTAAIVVQQQTNAGLRRDLRETRDQILMKEAEARAGEKSASMSEANPPTPRNSAGSRDGLAMPTTTSKESLLTHSEDDMSVARPAFATTDLSTMTAVEKLGNVGQGSARAAFETQLWAAHGGDVERETKAIVLGPKARAKMEALMPSLPEAVRAEYKTPEQLMAYVLSGSPRPVSAVQVLGETQKDSDTVVLRAAWQHEGSNEVVTNDVPFRRGPVGWQLVVSASLVERAVGYLTNQPLQPAKPSGE